MTTQETMARAVCKHVESYVACRDAVSWQNPWASGTKEWQKYEDQRALADRVS